MKPDFAKEADTRKDTAIGPKEGVNRLRDDWFKRAPAPKDNIDILKPAGQGHQISGTEQHQLDQFYRNNSSNYNLPRRIQTDKTVEDLFTQLGDSSRKGSFAKREEASKILNSMGDEVLPQLRKATTSGDLEIRNRASSLIREIEQRAIFNDAKSLLKTHEDLSPPKGGKLPTNWSQLCDQFVEQSAKIAKNSEKIQSYNRIRANDGSVESNDLSLLSRLSKTIPRLAVADLLNNYLNKSSSNDQQAEAVRNKSISMLAEALEKDGVKADDLELISLSIRNGAINNARFISAYRNSLAKLDPQWQSRSDNEIRQDFMRKYDPDDGKTLSR